eukprot:COSAG01_NODE_16423_length_1237_cov_1.449912_1_plen_101_part_10
MTLSDWRGLRVSGAVSHAGTQSAVVTEPTEPDSTPPDDEGSERASKAVALAEEAHQLQIGRQREMGSVDTDAPAAATAASAASHSQQPMPLMAEDDSSLLL